MGRSVGHKKSMLKLVDGKMVFKENEEEEADIEEMDEE